MAARARLTASGSTPIAISWRTLATSCGDAEYRTAQIHRAGGGRADQIARGGMMRKGEQIRETVGHLNDLLEMERAAAATVSDLIPMATTSAMGKVLEKLQCDEAWACAGLTRVIKHLGGRVSPDTGIVGLKRLAGPSLRDRLDLLTRDHAWVVREVDRILEEEPDRETAGFLRQMRALHAENGRRCEGLIMTLAMSRAGAG